jgi:8-oxo-dGTP pyrophosphatase MutT (NUDIX family)
MSWAMSTTVLPGELSNRSRVSPQRSDRKLSVAVPRLAATVAVLRDGTDGLETYLLRRPATMSFAPGAYVFPGGAVDPADGRLPDDVVRHDGTSEAWRASALSGPRLRELLVAAVRETFEEAAVLLTLDAGGEPPAHGASHWNQVRRELLAGSTSFSRVLQEHGLVLSTRLVSPWARWVTPEYLPIRFDTYFFVAPLPRGQVPRRTRAESSYARWITPRLALSRYAEGRLATLRPTRALLTALADFASTQEAMRSLAWLDHSGVDGTTPGGPRHGG